MRIEVHLLSQSQPMEYTDVQNAYTKDGMYCMLLDDGDVTKFPMVNIFRVKEFNDKEVTIEYEVEHLTIKGDITACHKNLLVVPKAIAKDLFEINNLDLSEDDDVNTLIGDDVIIYMR